MAESTQPEAQGTGEIGFVEAVQLGAEAGAQLGHEGGGTVGAALAETFGEHVGVSPALGEAGGEALGEPVGGILGAAGGAVTGLGLEAVHGVDHAKQAVADLAEQAEAHGGSDPMGGTQPPGGAPAGTYLGEVDDPGFTTQGGGDHPGKATYLGEVDDPGFTTQGGGTALPAGDGEPAPPGDVGFIADADGGA